jgi:hypothetical protein
MTVRRLLREGADSLKLAVVLKQVAGEFVSRRLVDRQLVADLIEQGPTLDRLQQAVAARVPAGLLDEMATRWRSIEGELEDVWEEHWQELAPGSDILTHVWQSYGRASYNKLHDGLAIAEALEPPSELADALRDFLEG